MWYILALIGIIAAIVAIAISHFNYRKKKKKAFEAEMIRVAGAKIVRSHHKAQKKVQKR